MLDYALALARDTDGTFDPTFDGTVRYSLQRGRVGVATAPLTITELISPGRPAALIDAIRGHVRHAPLPPGCQRG